MKLRIRGVRLAGVLVGTLACLALASGQEGDSAPKNSPGAARIVLAHTANVRGQVLPWRRAESGGQGPGLEALAAVLGKERERAASKGAGFVYVDAGDFWQGTPEGERTEGRAVTAWFEHVGLAALGLGDHDFDLGAHRMGPMLRERSFATLGSNLFELDTRQPPDWATSHLDLSVPTEGGEAQLTILAAMDQAIKPYSSPKAMLGLDLMPAIERLRREVGYARRRGSGIVVLLWHGPVQGAEAIASAVAGIDVIVSEGARQATPPAASGRPWIVGTAPRAAELGIVELSLTPDGKLTTRPRIAPVPADATDPAARAALEESCGELQASMNQELGEVPAPLRRAEGFPSSALGSWTADLMRRAVSAEVAITNKAGLRADVPAGTLRARDLYLVSPYGNQLFTLTLSGAELREALEFGLTDPGRALEVSGLTVRYDLSLPRGERVILVKVGELPLERERSYKVVTNSFLAKGGHGHTVLRGGNDRARHPIEVLDLQIKDVEARGRLEPTAEARIAPAPTTMPGG
ncbi:MAG: bifunctional metallophosphatase/5'-nucleotidase [Planctomycetota bacterium]